MNLKYFLKKKELTDDQIVEKIFKGKKEYFSLLTEKYHLKLTNYIGNMFGLSKDDTQDFVQEIFLKVWKNLDKYTLGTNFNAWIYKIAYNQGINLSKKKEKEITQKIPEFYDVEDNSKQGKDIIELEYKKKLIQKLLQNLNYASRTAIILYFQEGKTYDEIANILEMSKGSVGSLILRGKKKLKKIMEKKNLLNDTF